jgi:hypothetical protein
MSKKVINGMRKFNTKKRFTGKSAVFDVTNKEMPVRLVDEIDNEVSIKPGVLSIDRDGSMVISRGTSQKPRKEFPDFELEID